MRYYRVMLTLAVIIFAAAAVMYFVSFWTGEALGGPVYTCRLLLILILLSLIVPLLGKLDHKSLVRRFWFIIGASMTLAVVAVTMETVDAYAGREVFSQDTIFTVYTLVFIPILVVVFMLYFGYRSMGFEFRRDYFLKLLPGFFVLAAATVAVVMVPLATSSGDLAVRISDIFSLAVQLLALFLTTFIAATLGQGRMGRPWLFLSLALAAIVIQTILTAQLRVVGMVRTTELADLLVLLGYLLLILAAHSQYEISTGNI